MFGFGSGPTGPDETTMASLDAALRQPLFASPTGRPLTFNEDFRSEMAAAYRAGTVDALAPVNLWGDAMPLDPGSWPATDLVLKVHFSPDPQEFFVVGMALRQEPEPHAQICAFYHAHGAWAATEPMLVGPGGYSFSADLTFTTIATLADFATTREIICGALRLVAQRHITEAETNAG